MSSQITHTDSHQDTPLSPYTWHLSFDFQYLRPFHNLSQPHHVTASHLSPRDNHPSTGGRSERTHVVPSKNGRVKLIQLHSYQGSRLFPIFRRAASTVIPLLPKATFTPSIQPNLGLPRNRPPLTSAINTLLAIRYPSILSTCPNHLNTLWSDLLAKSLSIPALLFIPNSPFAAFIFTENIMIYSYLL